MRSDQCRLRPAHGDHRQVLPHHGRQHATPRRRAGHHPPSLLNTDDIGESTRESALPWDRINAAHYTPEPAELPVVSIISREHDERVAHDPDIVALQGDVDELDTCAASATCR